MPMQEGPMDYFECIDFGGAHITVRLEKIDTSASDPSWVIVPGPNKVFLEYLNENRDRYRAQCHCEVAQGTMMHVWIETEHNGHTEKNMRGILIQDWEGKQWTVDVENMNVRNGPTPVTFRVAAGVQPSH